MESPVAEPEADPIGIDDIIAASLRIKDYVHRTPILTSATIDDQASTEISKRRILFKCEHLQKIGAFKIRGATNALLQLSTEELKHGVVTHSSGNHAQALALAAQQLGVPAYVVMPNNSPQVKKDAVRGYGAQVTECEPTLEAREATCDAIMSKTGAQFIHPYNNPQVMAGQGTQMLEFLEQAAELGTTLDTVLIPCGGGGMLSRCATAARSLSPETLVFGAEPELANDAQLSLESGSRQPALPPKSCADGLLTCLGTNTFRMITKNVDAIFTVTEEQIILAMRLVWERMKQIIEPSAAVGLAVALYNEEFRALEGISTIGVILCGGNVSIDRALELFKRIGAEPENTSDTIILLKTKSIPNDPYEKILSHAGYQVVFVPVLDHAMVNGDELLSRCRNAYHLYSGLIVTSQRSVEAIGTALQSMTETDDFLQMPIYTVGPATCSAIRELGFYNILGSESGNGDALADYILRHHQFSDKPLFFVVGDKRRDIITRRMNDAGKELCELVVYETITTPNFEPTFQQAVANALRLSWIVFFSPAGADVALKVLKKAQLSTKIATIGPTTRDYLINDWDLTPEIVAEKPTPEALCAAIQLF